MGSWGPARSAFVGRAARCRLTAGAAALLVFGVALHAGADHGIIVTYASDLAAPRDAAVDAGGNIYVTDTEHHVIRRIDPLGNVLTIAGTGTAGDSGDGGPALHAQINTPHGIDVDSDGNVYIADSPNHRVRRVDPWGVITTLAGTGEPGFSGDGGPATEAQLNRPRTVLAGPGGVLYVTDTDNHRVRRIDHGVIVTVAGNGLAGSTGDGGPATEASMMDPRGLAVDAAGNLYIADADAHRVRRLDSSGIITTVAGTGVPGLSGDGGPATAAQLNEPRGVGLDAAGNLYIADAGNHSVRRVDTEGIITTAAGTGRGGYSGDGGPATAAQLRDPRGLAVTPAGEVYVADTGNGRVRRFSL